MITQWRVSALIRRLDPRRAGGPPRLQVPRPAWQPAPCLRVAHVTEAPLGGVLTHLQEVIAAQAGFPEVESVYALVPEINAPALRRLGDGKVVVRAFPHRRGSLLGLARLARATIRLVRETRPDILHVHSSIAGGVVRLCAPALRPKPKIVYCPHGWAFREPIGTAARRWITLAERLFATVTDRIACVSEHERQAALAAGLPPGKCRVIKNGIAELAPAEARGGEARPRRGKLKILFVGRFDAQKGFDIYLEVLRRLGDAVEGIAVGDYVVSKARPLSVPGNVTHLGWRPREALLRLYQEADLLLMPSRVDAMPLAALEAMRAGLPVFASRVGGLPEIVLDGITGRLFDAHRPEDIAALIRATSREELAAYGERGQARFLEHFTARRMNRELLDLYQRLVWEGEASRDADAGYREAKESW